MHFAPIFFKQHTQSALGSGLEAISCRVCCPVQFCLIVGLTSVLYAGDGLLAFMMTTLKRLSGYYG